LVALGYSLLSNQLSLGKLSPKSYLIFELLPLINTREKGFYSHKKYFERKRRISEGKEKKKKQV